METINFISKNEAKPLSFREILNKGGFFCADVNPDVILHVDSNKELTAFVLHRNKSVVEHVSRGSHAWDTERFLPFVGEIKLGSS